jgi:hypothetical protein
MSVKFRNPEMGGLASHWPVSLGALHEEEKNEEELRQWNNNNNNNTEKTIVDTAHILQKLLF